MKDQARLRQLPQCSSRTLRQRQHKHPHRHLVQSMRLPNAEAPAFCHALSCSSLISPALPAQVQHQPTRATRLLTTLRPYSMRVFDALSDPCVTLTLAPTHSATAVSLNDVTGARWQALRVARRSVRRSTRQAPVAVEQTRQRRSVHLH